MGSSRTDKKRSKKKYLTDTESSSTSASSSDSETSSERRSHHRSRERKHKRNGKGSSREKEKSDRRERHKHKKEKRKMKEEKERSRRKKRTSDRDDQSVSDVDRLEMEESPVTIIGEILKSFPDVAQDLKQLLQMIDDGQVVDTREISDRSFAKQLRKLLRSLNLKESNCGIFLLPPEVLPTLEIVGPTINLYTIPVDQHRSDQSAPLSTEQGQMKSDAHDVQSSKDDFAPKKRIIGPAMPSSELLAAAAKLTEAEAELRDAELETDGDLFIGPAPAAVAAEAASANEAERFEEVTRIMEAATGTPYDVLGVNHNMAADNMKKRYWKLSLMVHPDKCSHPQAQQAFVILNKAFKDIQDPDKRKAMDDKIRAKEEQERFQVELKAMREAAQWRRLQGISMAGDDELLAEVKLPPKREEWMTTLPPEKKTGGMPSMHSTTAFSRTTKEGRGDTSAWTDTPQDKTQKAKMNYLEAYNQATALASSEDMKRNNPDAELVDQYNRVKRSKSLVEKHQEESSGGSRKTKKTKLKEEKKKDEWAGQHPWKPWDREKDLSGGRQKVNLDPENMVQGLTSRFSGGNIQRNFL